VLLQSLGKGHGIKVPVCCRGIFEGFVVFFFNVEFIESIIDCLDVSRLDGYEVRFDERDVVRLFKHAYDASMIDTGSKSREKVGEESWMFLEVEVERSVVDLEIGSLDDDLFEGIMFLLIRQNGKGRLPMRPQNVPSLREQRCQTRRSGCKA
jgi:hypothetical protein